MSDSSPTTPSLYIITNRPIVEEGGKPRIDKSDNCPTTLNLRFASLYLNHPDAQEEVYPDFDLIQGRYRLSDYHALDDRNNIAGSEIWFLNLYHEMLQPSEKNDTLIFIHGFNCGYDCFLDTMRDLHQKLVQDPDCNIARVVGFTWPSDDRITEYRDDQEDARTSGIALARGYAKLLKFFSEFVNEESRHCGNKLHLLSHSMGNQVLEAMFTYLLEKRIPLVPLFREILMVAADVNYDIFEDAQPLRDINALGERVHVYFHESDEALKVSKLTKNRINRLGLAGPRNPIKLPMNVIGLDASDVKGTQGGLLAKFIDHSYFIDNPTVLKDIKQVLDGVNTEMISNRVYVNHKNIFRIKRDLG